MVVIYTEKKSGFGYTVNLAGVDLAWNKGDFTLQGEVLLRNTGPHL